MTPEAIPEVRSLPVLGSAFRWWTKRRDADEVFPDVHVSGGYAARSVTPGEFSHVFSVADGLTVRATTDSYSLHVDADPREQRREFVDAVNAVRDAIQSPGKVLIHCYEGRERAPTVTAAALAPLRRSHGWSFAHALEYIRASHPITDPPESLRELGEWYVETDRITRAATGYAPDWMALIPECDGCGALGIPGEHKGADVVDCPDCERILFRVMDR